MDESAGKGAEQGDGGVRALGESDALRCLPGARALILRLTRDATLTNDLCQDVMLAVVMAIREGRVKHPDALPAYVQQTSRHMVYASRRKLQPVAVESPAETETVWAETPATPAETYEADEQRRLALEVLEELPTERDRTLILGFYVDGLSKSDLMHRLQLTAQHFDKVLFRARTRMRDLLHERMNAGQQRLRDSAAPGVLYRNGSRHE